MPLKNKTLCSNDVKRISQLQDAAIRTKDLNFHQQQIDFSLFENSSNNTLLLKLFCDRTISEQGPLTYHKMSYNGQQNHKSTIHNIFKSFSCTYCDRTFSGKSQLTNHIKIHTKQQNQKKTIHNTFKSFPYSFYDRTFSGQGSLTNHQKTHTKQQKLSCTFCDRTFSRQGQLTNHIKSHTKNILHNVKNNSLNKAQSSVQSNHSINLNKEKNQYPKISVRKLSELLNKNSNEPKNFIVLNTRPTVPWHSMGENVQQCKTLCSNDSKRNHQDVAIQTKYFVFHQQQKQIDWNFFKNSSNTLFGGKTFSGQSISTNHKTWHTNPSKNSMLSTTAEVILPTFKPSDSIHTINNTHQSNRSGFKWNLCGKMYSTSSNLYKHQRSIHSTNNEPITCQS